MNPTPRVMPNARHRFTVGETVRSLYRAPWKGVVTAVEERKGTADLVTCNITVDRNGRSVMRRMSVTLDERWLEPVGRQPNASIEEKAHRYDELMELPGDEILRLINKWRIG